MKKYIYILLTISFINKYPLMAQTTDNNCACCTENHNQFDFWLGEWNVYNSNETLVGTNSITKQYNNCILIEKWVSIGKNSGTSTNYFDKTDGTWNQIWTDNSGYILKLKGDFISNSMVLKSEIKQGENGAYYDQISWTKNEDGTVTQLWEIYDKKNKKTSEAFKGIYKKKLN